MNENYAGAPMESGNSAGAGCAGGASPSPDSQRLDDSRSFVSGVIIHHRRKESGASQNQATEAPYRTIGQQVDKSMGALEGRIIQLEGQIAMTESVYKAATEHARTASAERDEWRNRYYRNAGNQFVGQDVMTVAEHRSRYDKLRHEANDRYTLYEKELKEVKWALENTRKSLAFATSCKENQAKTIHAHHTFCDLLDKAFRLGANRRTISRLLDKAGVPS